MTQPGLGAGPSENYKNTNHSKCRNTNDIYVEIQKKNSVVVVVLVVYV